MTDDLPVTDVIVQFTIVVSVALAIQFSLERFRLPGIVGLLLVGMVIGPGGLAVLPEEPVVELLGTIGLLFIMFVAGLEIDLDIVRHHKREAVAFGCLALALSLMPAVGVGMILGLSWTGALLIGAALASHTLVSYPIVKQLGLVRRKPIVTAIGGTLLTDTLALVLLAIVIQQPGGDNGGMTGWAIPLVLLGVLVAVCLVVVPRIADALLDDQHATLAEKTLLLLALLMILATAADAIGTEDILGAFLAGVCLNRPVQRRKQLREHVEFVGRMLFIPFFFIHTGMRLELAAFGQSETWALAGALLAVVVFGKTSAAWLTGSLYGYGRMDRIAMIGLTLPQAAATLAVIVIARRMELIGDEIEDAVIIVIFLTCLLGPLVTSFAGRRLAATGRNE